MCAKKAPEPELSFSVDIPPDLLKEFKADLRVVVRHPWIVGIPVPHRLITGQLREIVGKGQLFIVPEIGR